MGSAGHAVVGRLIPIMSASSPAVRSSVPTVVGTLVAHGKAGGFALNLYNRVRLSKGAYHKEHPKAWEYIVVEYEPRPGVIVENLQRIRAVYDRAKGRWELHLVCKDEIETPNAPGNEAAGVDLGIYNFAAVVYSTEEADLYPGNRLKQDGYYFPKEIANCDDLGGERATRLHHKWSERCTHFFNSLAKHIIEQCVEQKVGQVNVGKLVGVREDENNDSKNWGRHGPLDLHRWTFDRFIKILTYKAKVEGIEVVEASERDTSKTCCVCGRKDDSQRVERGLYVYGLCDAAFNADMNAENICLDINESNTESAPDLGDHKSTGWLAQPGVFLYDLSRSDFAPPSLRLGCRRPLRSRHEVGRRECDLDAGPRAVGFDIDRAAEAVDPPLDQP